MDSKFTSIDEVSLGNISRERDEKSAASGGFSAKLRGNINLARCEWVVDRFEGTNAVLVSTATMEAMSLPAGKLPPGAKPGDTLILCKNAWHFDHDETAARATRIDDLFKKIKAKM